LLCERGIIGIVSSIFLLTGIFRQGNLSSKGISDTFHKGLSAGFVAGFIGLLVHAIGANTLLPVERIRVVGYPFPNSPSQLVKLENRIELSKMN